MRPPCTGGAFPVRYSRVAARGLSCWRLAKGAHATMKLSNAVAWQQARRLPARRSCGRASATPPQKGAAAAAANFAEDEEENRGGERRGGVLIDEPALGSAERNKTKGKKRRATETTEEKEKEKKTRQKEQRKMRQRRFREKSRRRKDEQTAAENKACMAEGAVCDSYDDYPDAPPTPGAPPAIIYSGFQDAPGAPPPIIYGIDLDEKSDALDETYWDLYSPSTQLAPTHQPQLPLA